jgi:hypothetical protein
MANKQNLITPWGPGQSGNPKGKKKGSKNRSTITRMLLETQIRLPEHISNKLKEVFPTIPEETSAEYIMVLGQIAKAVSSWDTMAFNAVFDSAYGKAGYVTPTQQQEDQTEIEMTKDAVAKEIMKVAMMSQDPSEKLKALDLLMKHTAGYVTARDIVNALSEQEREELILQLSTKLDNNEK